MEYPVNVTVLFDMFFMVVGGLAIFLLGMNNMSSGMQAIAGDRLRQLISAVTNNRFMAISVGFLVTGIIQSSSITSVMVVGFVNVGVMTLSQAIGVILGADIGTTVTGWILALKIGKYGLPLLGVAGLTFLFAKKERLRYTALMVMGIGMIFFGLELMKNGFKPIREIPEFLALFARFTPDTFGGLMLCVMTGAFITAVVQSSSASVGIVMGMAATGVLKFDTSVALVLGMNIGTTITALLASIGTTTNAKRAAYGHTITKFIGVLWVLPIFPLFLSIVSYLTGNDPGTIRIENGTESYPYIIHGIAIAHTIFNIVNVVLFTPFITPLTKLLEKIVPEKPFQEQPRLTRYDIRMLDTPSLIIEQSRREIILMGDRIKLMFQHLCNILQDENHEKDNEKLIFQYEEELDTMQKEISIFLIDTIPSDITHDQVREAQSQLRIADEYESISDHIATILKLYLKMKMAKISLTAEKYKDILKLHEQVVSYFQMINDSFEKRHPEDLTKVYTEGNTITHHFRELRSNHLERLSRKKLDPLMSVCYMNMLNAYRTIKDQVQNVAEVLAGEKQR